MSYNFSGTNHTFTNNTRVGIGNSAPGSTLDIIGSVSMKITTITTSTTLSDAYYTVLCDATSGAIIVTLPSAAGILGRIYNIKKIDSSTNTITITTTNSQTIDGSTTRLINIRYETITIQSDGANWYII